MPPPGCGQKTSNPVLIFYSNRCDKNCQGSTCTAVLKKNLERGVEVQENLGKAAFEMGTDVFSACRWSGNGL